jgi:hypothetical protein
LTTLRAMALAGLFIGSAGLGLSMVTAGLFGLGAVAGRLTAGTTGAPPAILTVEGAAALTPAGTLTPVTTGAAEAGATLGTFNPGTRSGGG